MWWRCEKGHAWQAMPAARSAGESCPVCAGKVVIPGENDLATLYPEIAAQWDGEKNGELTAEMVSPYSNRKAWWRCREGHSWQAAIAARTKRKTGCPLLYGAEGAGGVQRPGHGGALCGHAVASRAKRAPYPRAGDGGEPAAGVVAVLPGPRVEGEGPQPDGKAAQRLPGVRRAGEGGKP